MIKLKLGPLADDKPVKLSIEMPAAVHRDLVAYARCWAARPDRRSPVQPN
jgi:hypothetical protein